MNKIKFLFLLSIILVSFGCKPSADGISMGGNDSISDPVLSDTEPPTNVLLTTSTTNIINSVTLTGTALDNVGVTKINFLLDGIAIPGAVDTTAPDFSYTWFPTAADNGTHNLKAKAFDAVDFQITLDFVEQVVHAPLANARIIDVLGAKAALPRATARQQYRQDHLSPQHGRRAGIEVNL